MSKRSLLNSQRMISERQQAKSTAGVVGRRRQARRSRALFEALEKRRLLSGYTGYTFTLTNQGSSTVNGTYLQGLINGTTLITGDGVTNHTVTLGDTLILPDGQDYDMGPNNELNLPNLGAGATATANTNTGAVTGLFLTNSGGSVSGYTAAPTVVIFGGGGSGATGSVTYNATTGTVTGIALGNAGSGYTSAPQVAIVGGAETLTIESSGYNAGSLGSGRFNPATDVPYDAQISSSNINGVVETVPSDSYGHLGAAQNYTFAGIEMAMDSATDGTQTTMIHIGTDASTQNYDQLVPNNFTFNQDYIHGGALGETSDDLATAALETSITNGLGLSANYVTVENSQISDIHSASNNGGGVETHAIGGVDLLGNYTINNNYLEATGTTIIFGGSENFLPDPAQANNLTITNNVITKNPAWNPNLPQYAGVPMVVKNDIEFKTGTNVTISHNLIQNVWVGADQRGEAINLSNLDTDKMNPWYNDANVTITDNVFRNVGSLLSITGGEGDTVYPPSDGDAAYTGLTNNVTFENNLGYNIGGFQWGYDASQWAIGLLSGSGGPMQNITIENNTIIGTDGIMYMEGASGLTGPAVANLVCENNVLDESKYGVDSTPGQDSGALNSIETAALTVTNPGSGYTAAPTVSISGGGGSGATATAYVWPQTEGGLVCPFAGQLMYIQITNYGSGYTANPTVSFNNTGTGGSGGAANAIAESNGQIHGYTFTNNVVIGGTQSNYPATNATTINYFPATENAAEMLDPAGNEYGLLPSSPYYADGTSGSVPGVNMANLTPGGSTEWIPSDSANSLQNYYKFTEGTGTTSADSGLGIGGATATATLSSSSLWTTSGSAGEGIALTGGTSGNVSIANFSADSSFTFAAWVKPTNFNATQYIASTQNSSSVSAFSLSINTSGQLVSAGTTGSIPGSTSTAIPAGQWSLVSLTFSGTTLTLYVNGNEAGSTTSATTTTGTTTLYIGGNQGSVNSFYGTIDEVRYYSTSLAQTMSVLGDNNFGRAGGGGYNTTTNGTAVTFTGGGGSGAAATAYAENSDGVITSILMTNNGSGYTAAPTMSFGATGSGALDTAAMSVTPLSYLYAQYGPYFENTFAGGTSVIKGTTTTLYTAVVTPDEADSAATYDWTVLTYPLAAGVGKPSVTNLTGKDFGQATITFSGAGYYLFQCVATNSVGQSATQYYPVTVVAVASTNVAFVSPANVSLAERGTQTFTVNGTSIANLSGITDQFGNPMPSAEWAWSLPVVSNNNDGTITSAGLYTAPNNVEDLGSVVLLKYTTGDGVVYTESTAAVNVTDANVPGAPATITVTPGANNSNVITWTAPPGGGETGYYVFQSTDGTYDGNLIYSSTNLSTLSFTDNAANDPTYAPVPGGTYYYYAEAFNANGGGANTAELGIVTGAPVAPSNLVATGGFTNSIGLTWTNTATNATGVEIERSTDDTTWTQVANLAGTSSSWTDNAANDPGNPPYGAPANDTLYYYYVQTYNTYTSLPSDTSSAQTISAPTGLTATAIASNQISVSWIDPSNGVAGFYLRYENANGGTTWTTTTLSPGDTSYPVTTGLSANTQYNFEVEAYTSAGNSGYSSAVGARTWQTAATPTVYEGFNYPLGNSTNMKGQSGGIGWSGAWAPVSGDPPLAVYSVAGNSLVDTNPTVPVAANLLTTGNSFQSSDAGDIIRTLSTISNSSGSTVWASALITDGNATPDGQIELIGNITGDHNVYFGFPQGNDFGFNVPSGGGVHSTTVAPTQNDTYLMVLEIQYGMSGSSSTISMWIDPNPTLPSSSWGTPQATSSSVTNLNNISSVEILGSASGPTNENFWDELRISAGASAGPVVPLAQPNAPTSLSATPGTNSITLSWTAPTEPAGSNLVQGYDIWRSTNDGTSYSLYTTVGFATLSYTDTGLTSGTTYYYEVTAENTTGDSLNSNIVNPLTFPAAPTGLAAVPGTSSITLTWTGNTNEASYTIQRSTDDATWGNIVTGVSNTASSYTDTTPTSGKTYYYQIEAVNATGDSAFDTIPGGLAGGAATIDAYEGFQYPTASTWTGAGATGIGFTGNWTVANSSNAKIVSGLNYTNGASTLTTAGNALQLTDNDTATQTLNQSVGAAGSTLWVGFEIDQTAGSTGVAQLKIGSSGTSGGYVTFGWFGGDLGEAIVSNTNNSYSPTLTYAATAGTTYFLVGEIQYLSSSPVITVYIDPQPNSANGAAPTNYAASVIKTLPSTGGILNATSALSFLVTQTTLTSSFDELRLGATYASVAPDPIVPGGGSTHRGNGDSPSFAPVSDVAAKAKKIASNNQYFFSALKGAWEWNGDNADNILLSPASDNNSWKGLFN